MHRWASGRWSTVSGGLVTAVGLWLLTVSSVHILQEHRQLVTVVLGGATPFVVALGTVVAGVALARRDLPRRHVARLLGWWVVGMGVTALLAGTTIVYEQSHGVTVYDARYIVTNNVTAGSVGGLLVGYFDVRSRQRAEELRDQSERLEVLNRVVRHDINNDMNVVLGWLQVLEDHVDDDGREALARVRRTSEHVVELTRITREYVAVIVGEASPDLHEVSVSDVLTAELRAVREAYPDVEFDVGEVPDESVRANEMLSSVFRNVLNNAVQHNDAADPRVDISAAVTDETVVVEIADNGPGIPDERKAAVFGKGDHGLESPGTGIGLYLVDTLVTEYGGDIHVEDNDPRGAVFVVELRRA